MVYVTRGKSHERVSLGADFLKRKLREYIPIYKKVPGN